MFINQQLTQPFLIRLQLTYTAKTETPCKIFSLMLFTSQKKVRIGFIKAMLFAVIMVGVCPLYSTAQNNEDAIVGRWMSSENNIAVEVYKQTQDFKAIVIWFDDTDDKSKPMNERLDEKNHDKNLRTRKIIGMEALRGLKYSKEDAEWQHGIIYDSSSGKEWDAKAWINNDGLLKVRGYWHFAIFGENMTFKRMK
ncbi:MAG: DUF2147 domain-containing protein [Ferruginibacter sp.]